MTQPDLFVGKTVFEVQAALSPITAVLQRLSRTPIHYFQYASSFINCNSTIDHVKETIAHGGLWTLMEAQSSDGSPVQIHIPRTVTQLIALGMEESEEKRTILELMEHLFTQLNIHSAAATDRNDMFLQNDNIVLLYILGFRGIPQQYPILFIEIRKNT